MLTSTAGIIASRKKNTKEYEDLVNAGVGGLPARGPDCYFSQPVNTDLDTFQAGVKLGASYNTGVAQTFVLDRAYYGFSVSVNLRCVNSTPSGNVYARIYYISGTNGSTAVPSNMLMELTPKSTSSIYYIYVPPSDPDIMPDDYTTVTFESPYYYFALLEPGVEYMLAIEFTGGDANSYLEAGVQKINLETNGNFASKTGSSWTPSTEMTLCMLSCFAEENTLIDFRSIKYNFNNVTNYRTIGVGGVQKVGISFTTTSYQILTRFVVFMKKVGSAANTTGYFYAELYASSSNQPTGSVIDTSDIAGISVIRSIYDQVIFKFTSGILLAPSTTYTLVIIYGGGTVSSDISIGIGQDTTTSGYTGNSFYQAIGSGTWTNETSTIDNCFIIGAVTYTETAFETYDATANGDQFNYIAATQNTKIAQSFTGVDGLFSKVTVSLRATGSPTGNITASLFADDGGGFGTSGKPTGTALATSGTIAASTIVSGAEAPYNFTFSGANLYTMTAGTIYWIAIEYSSGSNSNKIGVVMDISSGTAPGRAAYYNGTTWAFTTYDSTGTSGASDEMCYVLYALT